MIKVIVSFKNNTTNTQPVRDSEVAKSYVDAILSIFKHDGIIDDIEKIETIDCQTNEYTTVYPGVQS